jgi:hypothetical protein
VSYPQGSHAGSNNDVSLVFQRLDNRGTVIDADPLLGHRYPAESDAALRRRVKLESAYVKLYGEELGLSSSIFGRIVGSVPPKVMIMVDGDAFVAEFLTESWDAAGRRSSVLFFGYLPRDVSGGGLDHAQARLRDLFWSIDGLDARSIPSAWHSLRASLERVGREPVGQPRRPGLVPDGGGPATDDGSPGGSPAPLQEGASGAASQEPGPGASADPMAPPQGPGSATLEQGRGPEDGEPDGEEPDGGHRAPTVRSVPGPAVGAAPPLGADAPAPAGEGASPAEDGSCLDGGPRGEEEAAATELPGPGRQEPTP